MYDFHRYKGEYTEGYLGVKENFNGIVFLLREPNNSEPKNFWFKKVINGEQFWDDMDSLYSIRKSKIAASKYKNRFGEILDVIGCQGEDLYNAVYCNIHPNFGEELQTREYKRIMREQSKIIFDFLSEMHTDLIVFTCRDIYENLKKYLNPSKEGNGLIYSEDKRLKCFRVEKVSGFITVYEIYHPSFSGKIKGHVCENFSNQ